MSKKDPAITWYEKDKRWKSVKRVNGKPRVFSSSKPGLAGKREVKQQLTDWQLGLTNADVRVEQALKDFLVDVQTRAGSEHYIQRKNYCDHYISKYDAIKVCDISDQQWQNIINLASRAGVKGKPLSAKSLLNLRATIVEFCRWARRSRMIRDIPELSIPKRAAAGKPKHILAKDDLLKLFEPSDEWYINAWRLMVLTGMRPGEVYGLTVDDVDGDVIRVNRSINRLGEITPGKTKNAARTIPISHMARTVIDSQLSYARQGPWLFAERDGSQASPSIAYKHWRAYSASQGLTATLYGLRHTFVSLMKMDLPDAMMKAVVGHSKFMDTLKTYGHTVDGDMAKIRDQMDQVWLRFWLHSNDIYIPIEKPKSPETPDNRASDK